MNPLRRSRVLALLLALSAAAAGCVGDAPDDEGGEPTSAQSDSPTATTPAPFEPSFELVAPQVLVTGGDEPAHTGQSLSFRATFPAAAKVDTSRLTEVLWDFGDGSYAVGLSATHAYAEPGLYSVSVRVRDGFDRTNATSLLLPVVTVHAFSGTIDVGSTGADTQPPSGSDAPQDHVDHIVTVPDGEGAHVRAELAFPKEGLVCPQPGVCIPGEPNLVLRLIDAQGNLLAQTADGPQPRIVEAAIAEPGDVIVRVSGDKGVDVAYELTVTVSIGGT